MSDNSEYSEYSENKAFFGVFSQRNVCYVNSNFRTFLKNGDFLTPKNGFGFSDFFRTRAHLGLIFFWCTRARDRRFFIFSPIFGGLMFLSTCTPLVDFLVFSPFFSPFFLYTTTTPYTPYSTIYIILYHIILYYMSYQLHLVQINKSLIKFISHIPKLVLTIF